MKRAQTNRFFQPDLFKPKQSTEKKTTRSWGGPKERERHLRIKVAVAAYAYEIKDDPIMSDAKWDRLARKVNLKRNTGNPEIDEWFRENFSPHTGMWVRKHPDRKGLKRIYKLIKGE